MSSTNFVNGSTLSDAGWANDVDKAVYNRLTSVSGTNTIVGTGPVSMTAYAVGQYSTFVPAATNTGPATMNITPSGASALGARDIFSNGVALGGGELKINVPVVLWDDGTRFHIISSGASALVGAIPNEQNLTAYLLPSMSDGWRGIYRAGFDWWSRNQQWGGPFGFSGLVDGATGTAYSGEAATGYIDQGSAPTAGDIGANAAQTWRATGFKVAETQTAAAIWLPVYKTGNPTGSLSPFILPDDGTGTKPTGSTPITNGTATAQSGKLFKSGTGVSDYQWHRFAFATPPTLTGGTQYHISAKSSAAVDASNYFNIPKSTTSKYPFGASSYADGTPTWTAQSGTALMFMVELSSGAMILQGSGQFDGKLQFGGSGASGTLTMSRGLCSTVAIGELLDPHEFTLRIVMKTAPAKDQTIWDTGYGQDHDRFVLRCAATTGYATLTRYDSSGTVTTVTDTYDLSSAGPHDVWIYSRNKGDGSDALKLYRAGAAAGTPLTAQTITLDPLFLNGQVGTMWVGGGFALAPTWSGSSIGINGFSAIPSSLGWTHNGAATEANVWSVSGGKLFQNAAGDTGSQDSYYTKAWAAATAAGWVAECKARVVKNTNTQTATAASFAQDDGTFRTLQTLQEYFLLSSGSAFNFYPQFDAKSIDNVYRSIGKGANNYIFKNGKLIVDGTANLGTATISNRVYFGDLSTTAGEKADIVWSKMNYYVTEWNPSQFTTASIDELAIWSGDRTAIIPALYNGGTLISVKQYCGLPQNYIDKSAKLPIIAVKGVTTNPTTASTTQTEIPEMNAFVLGEEFDASAYFTASNDTVGQMVYLGISIDGDAIGYTPTSAEQRNSGFLSTANYRQSLTIPRVDKKYLGLHAITAAWGTTAGTVTGFGRSLTVSGKV